MLAVTAWLGPVEFHKAEVKEITGRGTLRTPDGFTRLFNGKDLSGWQKPSPGLWKVDDGVLIGRGMMQNQWLATERDDYQDFHLRAEVRINEEGDSGLIARWRTGGGPAYEVNILCREPAVRHQGATGSIYDYGIPGPVVRVAKSPVPADEWFVMELLAIGNRIIVIVNHQKIADYEDIQRRSARGHIALQLLGAATRVEFRSVEVKELAPTTRTETSKPAAEPVSRRARFNPQFGLTGWKIEGDELVQTKAVGNFIPLSFGGLEWADYDFSVRIKSQDRGMVFVAVRDRADRGCYVYKLGTGMFPEEELTLAYRTNAAIASRSTSGLPSDRWHDVRVSVRGDRIRCFLNGKQIFDVSDSLNPNGAVYLRSWKVPCRFRDIKATAPDGKVLWEGLPELPE
jgi:hypothetical protein